MPMAPEPTTSSDLGMTFGHHGFLIGPDQLAVGLEAGEDAGPRTGGQDDVLGGEVGDRLAVLLDLDLAAAGELRLGRRRP